MTTETRTRDLTAEEIEANACDEDDDEDPVVDEADDEVADDEVADGDETDDAPDELPETGTGSVTRLSLLSGALALLGVGLVLGQNALRRRT